MRFLSNNTPLDVDEEVVIGQISPGLADHVAGLVFSDQDGSLKVDQSSDGENWDYVETVEVTGSTGEGFSFPVYAPYVRVRYINGGVAQDVFRVSVKTSSAGPR